MPFFLYKIVKLNAESKEIVAREQVLREEIDQIIAEIALPAGRGEIMNKWYVYVMLCDDGSWYKGHTDNLERRYH